MHAIMCPRRAPESLLDDARRGDAAAFAALLEMARAELRKYVAARLGEHLRRRLEVEDILQETAVRAWQSIGTMVPAGKDAFVRWLKGIARHVILQEAARRGHAELIVIDREPDTGAPSPSRGLRLKERFDRLREAVERLPPEHREAVLLVRIDGLKVAEAARRMGRTQKSVAHLLSRGLAKLKDLLADTESLSLPPERLERRDAGERDRHDR